MRNPLTSLDELIWKQFEKVTNAAYNRLGWDKWDLVRIMDVASVTSVVGYGTYATTKGIYGHSLNDLGSGSFFIFIGGLYLAVDSYLIQFDKEKEKNLVTETRVVPSPQFRPWRPVWLAVGPASILGSMWYLLQGMDRVPSSFPSLSVHQYNTLSALVGFTIGAGNLFAVCSSYFKSQLPRPPSTAKKSLWQVLTDYVIRPFHKPQEAKVTVQRYEATS